MSYIDFHRLEQIDAQAYRNATPYPWTMINELLSAAGYRRLLATLPEVDLFASSFGKRRKNTQQAHDRFVLEYHDQLAIAPEWHEFIAELGGARYKEHLCRLLGERSIVLNFHWHYTPRGCSVSPHADSVRKAGSHIFYFNTHDDWDPQWGGQTLVLDDGGAIPYRSSP